MQKEDYSDKGIPFDIPNLPISRLLPCQQRAESSSCVSSKQMHGEANLHAPARDLLHLKDA